MKKLGFLLIIACIVLTGCKSSKDSESTWPEPGRVQEGANQDQAGGSQNGSLHVTEEQPAEPADATNKPVTGNEHDSTQHSAASAGEGEAGAGADTGTSTSTSKSTSKSKVDSKAQSNSSQVKTKQAYLQKLEDVENSLSDLEELDAGDMEEMNEAAAERYKRWDKALNEIYGALKKQLSKEEMAKLKQEQLKWIKHRDDQSEEAASDNEGGTLESFARVSTQAELTRERCYELVKTYMK